MASCERSGWRALALPALMLVQLFIEALPAMKAFGFGFLTGSSWDPVCGEFGAFPFIYGTVVTSLLALLLAVPVSLGVAIFLSDLAPRVLQKPLGFLVELLAAIPSVVYGFWGIFVLVPWLRESVQPFLQEHLGFLPFFQGPPIGFGMLAAGIILAIMIVPTIASISREVLRAVPDIHREAAIGLGATRWDVIRHGVLPTARWGILGAVILGLNRAIGETMAVTMVDPVLPQGGQLSVRARSHHGQRHRQRVRRGRLRRVPGCARRDWLAPLRRRLRDEPDRALARRQRGQKSRTGVAMKKGTIVHTSLLDASPRARLRHLRSELWTGLCTASTVLGPVPLFSVLLYITARGIAGLSLEFSPTCRSRWERPAAAWATPSSAR